MGHNLNLIQMLNVPTHVVCPNCGTEVDPGFYEYDVDCRGVNPAPGVWCLDCYCGACEHEWTQRFTVTARTDDMTLCSNCHIPHYDDVPH